MYRLSKIKSLGGDKSNPESEIIKEAESVQELKHLGMKIAIEDKEPDTMWLNSPDLNYYDLRVGDKYKLVIKKV